MNRINKITAIIAFGALALSMVGCNKTTKSESKETTIINVTTNVTTEKSISVESDTISLDEWETIQVKATASDGGQIGLGVEDSSIVYIKGSKITGIKAGTTTIVAYLVSDTTVTKTINVTVNEKASSRPELVITGSSIVEEGGSTTVSSTLSKVVDASYTVSYESSNADVFTVSSNGEITGIGIGSATLIAKTKYKSVTFEAEKEIMVGKRVAFEKGEKTIKIGLKEFDPSLDGTVTAKIGETR